MDFQLTKLVFVSIWPVFPGKDVSGGVGLVYVKNVKQL